MEQGTCPPGNTQHDYCLAMDEEASIGCGDTRAFCPTEPYNFSSGDPLDAITCDRCAMVTMENWDQRIWLGGEVRWAPFARSEEDEMQLEGYNVGVLDACGVEIKLLGSVPVRSGMFAESVKECCANSWYAVHFGHYLPPESVSISISSWSGLAELRLATALPLFQATTSTTTETSLTHSSTSTSSTSSTTSSSTLSTTSWTDTTTSTTSSSSSSISTTSSSSSSSSHTTFALAPAQLEGCIGLMVTDVDAFLAEPGAMEALRQTLAQAAGVRDTYIQQISLSEGSCDGVTQVSGTVNDTTDLRRLQSALRTDYVVVFPAALGVEAALQAVEQSRQALETISVEEVTQILQEEVQRFPSIANISVTVSTKAVTMEVTNEDAAGGVYFCTEEQRPHIDGAGEYTCTGNPGKGQKCTAPCSGSDVSAEIICWSSREWLVTEPCLSQSEGMAAWLVFLIVFLCCLIVLLVFGLVFAVYTGACKKVTPEDDDVPAPKDAWTATPPPSHASPRPASPDAPAPVVATGAADISFVTGLPWEAKRASSREERSRPGSREARSKEAQDAPPVETVETLKTRSSRSRSPEAPKEQYLDSGDFAGQTTGAFSPGGMPAKETVTFMVDQQQDFRVWVQQDLPQHPLPQNTTVYPGTIQYD